jgi:hypothetical protein
MQNCLATVNTIHNCAAQGCIPVRNRAVVQERQVTTNLELQVEHNIEPDDILLNLAQLHSAKYVQLFQWQTRYPAMSRATLIDTAVANHNALVHNANLELLVQTTPSQNNTGGPASRKRTRRSTGNNQASKRRQGDGPAPSDLLGEDPIFSIDNYNHEAEHRVIYHDDLPPTITFQAENRI